MLLSLNRMFQILSFKEPDPLCFLWDLLNLRLIDVRIHQKNVPVYKTHPFVSCGDGTKLIKSHKESKISKFARIRWF